MRRNLNKNNIGSKRKSRKERATIAIYNDGIKEEVSWLQERIEVETT